MKRLARTVDIGAFIDVSSVCLYHQIIYTLNMVRLRQSIILNI